MLIISKKKKLWEPSEEWIKNAEITRFIEFVNKEYGQDITPGMIIKSKF